MNLVTPKAGAKRELLFVKPASGHSFCSYSGFVEHLKVGPKYHNKV